MGRGAGKSGGDRGNGSAGRGKGGRKTKDSAVPTRRAGKVGACAALGNHIFTISSGNKARDGDTLRTTKEAMITYIGTQYGEDTSKEFATGVLTVLTIPPTRSSHHFTTCYKSSGASTTIECKNHQPQGTTDGN